MLAIPPQQYRLQDKLIYTIGTVDMIISLWKKAPRSFQEERLSFPQRWFDCSKTPEPDAEMKPRDSEEEHSQVPATALDSSQEADASNHKRKQESPTKKAKSPPIGSALEILGPLPLSLPLKRPVKTPLLMQALQGLKHGI